MATIHVTAELCGSDATEEDAAAVSEYLRRLGYNVIEKDGFDIFQSRREYYMFISVWEGYWSQLSVG